MPDKNPSKKILEQTDLSQGMRHAKNQAEDIEHGVDRGNIDTLVTQVDSKVEELERGAGKQLDDLAQAEDNLETMRKEDQFSKDYRDGLVESEVFDEAMEIIEIYQDILPRFVISRQMSFNLYQQLHNMVNEQKLVNDESRVEGMIDKTAELTEKNVERTVESFEDFLDKRDERISGSLETLEDLKMTESEVSDEIRELRKERKRSRKVDKRMIYAINQLGKALVDEEAEFNDSPEEVQKEIEQSENERTEQKIEEELGSEFLEVNDSPSRQSKQVNTGSSGNKEGRPQKIKTKHQQDDPKAQGYPTASEDTEEQDSKELDQETIEEGAEELMEENEELEEVEAKVMFIYEEKHEERLFEYEIISEKLDLEYDKMWDHLENLEDDGHIELV